MKQLVTKTSLTEGCASSGLGVDDGGKVTEWSRIQMEGLWDTDGPSHLEL